MNPLRWGILGTAGIARKNWRALRYSGNCVVTAVASRDIERARQFIGACHGEAPFERAPDAHGSYDSLLDSDSVEAVYVPLPTGLRKDWVLRAAAAGKHVLCEKPCALDASDLREMIEACRRHNVQFMDGVMFMHNPRMQRIRRVIDDPDSLGVVKRIMSLFTFRAVPDFFDGNIRAHSVLEPTGCLGDLGWYCIRISLWAMNWRMPREVTGRVLSSRGNNLSPGATPIDFSGELVFDDESSAGFFCSFLAEKQQWVDISGTRGQVRWADFVHPLSEHEPVFEINYREQRVKYCECAGDHVADHSLAQDATMFRNFANQVRTGRINEDWPEIALKTQQVMDACYSSALNGGRPFRTE